MIKISFSLDSSSFKTCVLVTKVQSSISYDENYLLNKFSHSLIRNDDSELIMVQSDFSFNDEISDVSAVLSCFSFEDELFEAKISEFSPSNEISADFSDLSNNDENSEV